ncbi:hypothetical protein [Nocardia sp. NPDC052566]|uniref:hypothetical protein n=1 Tax=Nocardia sp. NPDC052566 TaxID=3364330 RepID=UPI0037C96789
MSERLLEKIHELRRVYRQIGQQLTAANERGDHALASRLLAKQEDLLDEIMALEYRYGELGGDTSALGY